MHFHVSSCSATSCTPIHLAYSYSSRSAIPIKTSKRVLKILGQHSWQMLLSAFCNASTIGIQPLLVMYSMPFCWMMMASFYIFPVPAAERIVYSTCSIHQIENEDVVKSVLPLAASHGFQLAPVHPQWPRRGLPVLDGCKCLKSNFSP